MTPEEELARYEVRCAALKRKVAKLEAEKDWAERERDITQRWAEKSWEEVEWLRRLCERYYEAGVRLQNVHVNGPSKALVSDGSREASE